MAVDKDAILQGTPAEGTTVFLHGAFGLHVCRVCENRFIIPAMTLTFDKHTFVRTGRAVKRMCIL